jgi:hypothetical protein
MANMLTQDFPINEDHNIITAIQAIDDTKYVETVVLRNKVIIVYKA